MLRPLWPLLAGFTLWALAFVAVYGLQYMGCRFDWAPGTHRIVLVLACAAAIGAVAATLVLQLTLLRHRRSSEMRRMGAGATIAALAATAITLGPTLFVSSCT